MNKRVLIAGCGDLGIQVAKRLVVKNDTRCWGLRRTTPFPSHIPGFEWISADLCLPDTLKSLPEGITDLVFAAAPTARTEADYAATYLMGLQNIIEALDLRQLKRVVFISSTAVYGDHGDEWIDETTPTEPKAFNGRILLKAEQWLNDLAATHSDLRATSLRLSGIYGPGRNYLLDRLKQGQASAPENDSHWVNRIHIEDAAAAIEHVLSLTQPAPVYLVTDSTPLPLRTLYEALAKMVDGPPPPYGPAPAMVGSKRLSNQLLLKSGFKMKWPDTLSGHATLLSGPSRTAQI